MHKMLISTMLAGAAFVAVPASAATFIEYNGASLIDNKIHAFSDPAYPATGTSVYGKTTNEDELVKFSSTDTIHVTTGSGYASIDEDAGVSDWDNLTIQLDDATLGFTALEFALQYYGKDVGQQDPGTLALRAYFEGGGYQDFTIGGITNQSDNKFRLLAEGSEVFKSVALSSVPDRFFQLKQSDIILATGAVPEPATWAMMLLGFGIVGGAMRRRKVGVSYQMA